MIEHERESEKKVSAKTKFVLSLGVFAMFLGFILSILISLLAYSGIMTYINRDSYSYFTSQYSKYCYGVGDVAPEMKTIQYFRTLQECGKPLYGE